MLEAGDGQPPSHLSQLRSAEQAPVACASSREVQTRGSNTMICGDKQRLKKSRVFLIDRFGQGHSTSWSHHAAPTGRRVSPPPPSLPSALPTERSGHGDGSTVQATAAATSTVIEATARRQERIRSGRCGRSGSGRPSLRSPRKPYGFCWFERGRELGHHHVLKCAEPRTCCSRASFCHGKNSLLFARVTRLVSAPGSHATTSS